MNKLYLLFTITERARSEEFTAVFKPLVPVFWQINAQGTASGDILDYLGLEESEKKIYITVCETHAAKNILNSLVQDLMIDVPGNGIAFTVPLSSIGGRKALELVTLGQEKIDKEEQTLKGTEYEIILAVANQEYTELVMEAARKANASGGTVIHAKGTQTKEAEKFLGMTLAEEKGIVLILTKTEEKNEIMQAIIHEAGMDSKAQSLVFSLPVTKVVGLREAVQIEEV